VAGAVSEVVPPELAYSLSLDSKQGNAHLHWHVAPLSPDAPYDREAPGRWDPARHRRER
jgi:diadenosine tetraphosphate (Ap4A) HIT family hydrolase